MPRAACLRLDQDSDKVRCSSIRALGIVLLLPTWPPSGRQGPDKAAGSLSSQAKHGDEAAWWTVPAISCISACLVPEGSSKVRLLSRRLPMLQSRPAW